VSLFQNLLAIYDVDALLHLADALACEVEVLHVTKLGAGGKVGLYLADGIFVGGDEVVVHHSYPVGLAYGGLVQEGSHVPSVRISAEGLPFALLPVFQTVNPRTVWGLDADAGAIGIAEFEGNV
jgi:hypothetical protein